MKKATSYLTILLALAVTTAPLSSGYFTQSQKTDLKIFAGFTCCLGSLIFLLAEQRWLDRIEQENQPQPLKQYKDIENLNNLPQGERIKQKQAVDDENGQNINVANANKEKIRARAFTQSLYTSAACGVTFLAGLYCFYLANKPLKK